jgi:hypothetical protein
MTKSLRRLALIGTLILAVSLNISAGTRPPPPRGPDDLWVLFMAKPGPEVCNNATYQVVVQYWRGSKQRPDLAPLIPDGELVTTANKGSLYPDSSNVGNNGFVFYVYTPGETGLVNLDAKLTYPDGQWAESRSSFKVKDCKEVKFKIDAKAEVIRNNDKVKSSAQGMGMLDMSGDVITGEFQIHVEYSIEPNDATVSCSVTPARGFGSVKVAGSRKKDLVGNPYIELNLSYTEITNFAKGKVTCYSKLGKKGKMNEYDIKPPKTYDPATDLKIKLNFSESETRLIDTFGPEGVGQAEYTLFYDW